MGNSMNRQKIKTIEFVNFGSQKNLFQFQIIPPSIAMSSQIKTDFGLEDKMGHGLHREIDQVMQPIHPIEISERNFDRNVEKTQMKQLQKLQGIHAPLRLMREKKAVQKVGHFPCISTRSNFQLDILEGNDDIISFGDVLGSPEHYEGMAQPHDIIEKNLAIVKK